MKASRLLVGDLPILVIGDDRVILMPGRVDRSDLERWLRIR